MRYRIILPALLILSACGNPIQTEAEDLVRERMRDPRSVQFEGVRVAQDTVCGRYNAKNAYGAYTGFERFVVSAGSVFFEPDREALSEMRSDLSHHLREANLAHRAAEISMEYNTTTTASHQANEELHRAEVRRFRALIEATESTHESFDSGWALCFPGTD